MRFCEYCGKELKDDNNVCPECGCEDITIHTSTDAPSKLVTIISFIIPIVGIILYFAWKKTSPLKAKSALIGVSIYGMIILTTWIFNIIL